MKDLLIPHDGTLTIYHVAHLSALHQMLITHQEHNFGPVNVGWHTCSSRRGLATLTHSFWKLLTLSYEALPSYLVVVASCSGDCQPVNALLLQKLMAPKYTITD